MKLNLQFLVANLALALSGFGYFSPWVAPRPVALQLSAHDLVEWLTFVQTVRDGTFAVSRVDLSWPLAGVAILTILIPSLRHSQSPKRSFLVYSPYLLLGLFAAFLIEPAYPFILTAYNDPELSPQFWLGVITGLGVSLLTILVAVRPTWARWLVPICSLTSIVVAVRAYTLLEPPLTDILTKPAPVGFGYVLYLVGSTALFVISVLTIVRDTRKR